MKKELEKWVPILNNFQIDDEMKDIMLEYCDRHTKIENDISLMTMNTQKTLLPLSLKILSNLNLKGKNVIFEDSLEPMVFRSETDIKKDDHFDLIGLAEKKLSNLLVEYLNKELETKNNLHITTLVSRIQLIGEKNFPYNIYLESRCKVD